MMIRLSRLTPLFRRMYANTSKPRSPKEELARVAELQRGLSGVTAHDEKRGTIARFPDLRELLEFVYHPKTRLHYTSTRLRPPTEAIPSISTPRSRAAGSSTDPPTPDSLLELFHLLSSRSVTGGAADRLVASFLSTHDISDDGLSVFKQLLDRNLVSGFRSRTLEAVRWVDENSDDRLAPTSPSKGKGQEHQSQWSPPGSWEISVALGVPLRPPYDVVGKLASRKYDGVRVVAVVDFVSGKVSGVRFLSRQGNEFASLAVLEEELRRLDLSDPAVVDRYAVQEFEGPAATSPTGYGAETARDSTVEATKHRLVLDGEVCAMTGAKEDFTTTVSQIRRRSAMAEPAYFVFDTLTWPEFRSGTGSRPLTERLRDLTALVGALDSSLVRPIEQTRVADDEHLARLVADAGEKGWEGLILRSDVGYRGKRTSDIAKIKSWSDAEYAVVARQTGRIFLAGRVQEACTSLVVEHRGHRVNVGSGLSTEQRLRYVDEKEILGKTVTVQYFEETEKSLRFPTVKRVWDGTEDGGRDV